MRKPVATYSAFAVASRRRSRGSKRGFPAKPFALKSKVDRTVGLLFAVTADERTKANNFGFPVLEAVPGRPHEFVAMLHQRPAFDGEPFSAEKLQLEVCRLGWMGTLDGLVIHPLLQRPITSDYDLAAIIHTEHYSHFETFGSWKDGVSYTNVYTEWVGMELNRLFLTERIMHGTEVQFVREFDSTEHIVEFHPDGTVKAWPFTGSRELDDGIAQVVLLYGPDEAAAALGPH